MAITVEMPKLSDTMSEGVILSWKKQEGDAVEPGDVLAEVESDKANMELEVFDAGYIRKLIVAEGEAAPVGAPVAILTEEPDEDISTLLDEIAAAPAAAAAGSTVPTGEKPPSSPLPPRKSAAAGAPETHSPTAPAAPVGRGKVRASPLAFRMAAELGIDLNSLAGSGPEGRIVKRDIEQALAGRGGATASVQPSVARPAATPSAAALPAAPEGAAFEDVPVSSIRKIIGARLSQSKSTTPHFYATVEIDMAPAMQARERLNRLPDVRISFNDMVVKAVAVALLRHPPVNASWRGEFIRFHKTADIGVAVAIPDGLITPVVRSCHLKGLARIAAETRELVARARSRKLTPDEYQGGTFTISNMGMLGIADFTGIINPPEAALLAVGAIRSVPVVDGEKVIPGKRMSVTLSSDHRVVDGAQAAGFLADVKEILENPAALAL